MKNKIPNPSELHMTGEQMQRFFHFAFGDDLDFYEEYTIHLSDEQQEKFLNENPEFMSEFSASHGIMREKK